MPDEPISTEVRDSFLASSPPRRIPEEISRRVIPRNQMMVMLLAGAVFLSIGLVMCSVFVPRNAIQQWSLDKGPVEHVPGRILSAEDTRATVNEERVWKYTFGFRPEGSPESHGEAYTTGRRWTAGQPVEICYLPGKPWIATPVGARMDQIPLWGTFVLIFPLVGLAIMGGAVAGRISKMKLLREGLVDAATVTAVEKSAFGSEDRNSYMLRMTRRSDGISCQKRSMDAAEIGVSEERLKSGEPLTVLNDRKNPKRFLIIDSWNVKVPGPTPELYFRENPLSRATVAADPRMMRITGEFLTLPVPRHIPREIRKKAAPLTGMLLLQAFGTVFFAVGLLFSWFLLPFHLPKQWLLDVAPSKTVSGEIISVEDSNVSINEVKIMKHRFRYRPEGARGRDGVAYRSTGDWVAGMQVTVRYLQANPAIAVPEGARMGASTPATLWVLIFPLLGGSMLFGPMLFRFMKLRVLRNGRVSTALITSVEETSVEINGQRQYAIQLTRSEDGWKMIRRTHFQREVAFAMRRWQGGEPVKILYLSGKSQRLFLPESWCE